MNVTNHPGAVGVMELLKRRFPQATLLPYASENAMTTALVEWRREFVDQFSDSDDVDTDDIVRFDSCVNGYGAKQTLVVFCDQVLVAFV